MDGKLPDEGGGGWIWGYMKEGEAVMDGQAEAEKSRVRLND